MSGARARINIFAPAVCRCPELNVIARYKANQAKTSPSTSLDGAKREPLAVAEVAAAVMEEEQGVGGSGRSLYVIDSQGRLLEHVRYQGSDYRSALRAAINATPNHWKE